MPNLRYLILQAIWNIKKQLWDLDVQVYSWKLRIDYYIITIVGNVNIYIALSLSLRDFLIVFLVYFETISLYMPQP